VQHISCFGKGDAVISLFDKDTTDFFSVSGSNYAQSGVTRYEPLQKGTYILRVKSIDDCLAHDTARVFEPQEIKLKISDKSLIKLNYGGVDTLRIISNKNNLVYQWNTKEGFFKEYSPTLIGISPEENVLYQLRGKDDKGCEAFAEVAVEINKRFPIYIPNTFSPNEDGKNDSFTIFADPEDVAEILDFQIYDRWGTKVFHKENFQPNIEAEGWNGSNYNNNVFVYQALILFKDGTEVVFKGDVMLLK
jgi:gliding motility-associated-like protein